MPAFSLDESVGFLTNRTALRLKRELHQAFKAKGHTVTPEQWAILSRLWEQEGLTQVELAELTLKDKPNMTRMLAVLETDGLIYRQPDPADRRASKIFLTDAGRRLKDQLVPLAAGVLKRAQRGFTAQDLAQLRRLLNALEANLD